MAVPVHKLPELLRIPFLLPNLTKLVFTYPPHRFANNNPRHFYKAQAPNIKYYNAHLQVVLTLLKDTDPKIEAFAGEKLVGVVPNTVPSADIAAELRKLHDAAQP